MLFKIKSLQTLAIVFSCFFIINLNAQTKEVWTDMRPVFTIENLDNGSIRMAFPDNNNIDIRSQPSGPPLLLPYTATVADARTIPLANGGQQLAFQNGNDVDFKPQPSGAVSVAINRNTIFEIVPQKGGTLRITFPNNNNIDFRSQHNGSIQLHAFQDSNNVDFKPIGDGGYEHSGTHGTTQLLPTKDHKIQVNFQPK